MTSSSLKPSNINQISPAGLLQLEKNARSENISGESFGSMLQKNLQREVKQIGPSDSNTVSAPAKPEEHPMGCLSCPGPTENTAEARSDADLDQKEPIDQSAAGSNSLETAMEVLQWITPTQISNPAPLDNRSNLLAGVDSQSALTNSLQTDDILKRTATFEKIPGQTDASLLPNALADQPAGSAVNMRSGALSSLENAPAKDSFAFSAAMMEATEPSDIRSGQSEVFSASDNRNLPPQISAANTPGIASNTPNSGQDNTNIVSYNLRTPVQSPQFSQAAAEQIHIAIRSHVQQAEIRVTPENMGPIQVQIKMNGTDVSLSIAVAQADTRQVIDDSLSKLRDMLNASGIQLGHTQLSQDMSSWNQNGQTTHQTNNPAGRERAANESSNNANNLKIEQTRQLNNNLLDLYA